MKRRRKKGRRRKRRRRDRGGRGDITGQTAMKQNFDLYHQEIQRKCEYHAVDLTDMVL